MSLLGRDFGPMLTAERSSSPPSDTPTSDTAGHGNEESAEEEGVTREMRERALSVQDELEEDIYTGWQNK